MTHKIVVKLFARDAAGVGQHEFVPVFHSWIQLHSVPDHLLIDVADYAHVHNGPGTVLIAHEANFYADRAGGRLGLTYSRKLPAAGEFRDRLRQAFAAALEGCARIEEDPRLAGRIQFRTDEALIRLNDRLFAPNTADTLAAVRPELRLLAAALYAGADVAFDQTTSEPQLFEVRLKASQSPPIATLLTRLNPAAATAPC